MIEPHEVQAAIKLAFPDSRVHRLTGLTGGFDFVVYKVDFEQNEPVVFRGQRNLISHYEGALDFGRILLGEIRFFWADIPYARAQDALLQAG